jgi:hypothetical protein
MRFQMVFRACAACATLTAFSPCAFAMFDWNEPLSMKYERADRVKPAVSDAAVDCKIKLREVIDARRNKDTVGANYSLIYPNEAPTWHASIRSGDGAKWLRQGLETLPIVSRDQGTMNITVSMRMAQTWKANSNVHAHVALQAALETSSGIVTRRYHGLASKTSLAGITIYMTALNSAMGDALDALAADMDAACSGKALSPEPT